MCVCVYTHTNIYIHTYIHINKYIYMNTCLPDKQAWFARGATWPQTPPGKARSRCSPAARICKQHHQGSAEYLSMYLHMHIYIYVHVCVHIYRVGLRHLEEREVDALLLLVPV